MIVRIGFSIVVGSIVTLGLLLVMQLMIETGRGALTEARAFRVVDFVRVARDERIETKQAKPDRPPQPETPPETPTPDLSDQFETELSVSVAAPAMAANPSVASVGYGISDGEYLPIVKVAPVYPNRALTRGLEGYVIVEFTVTRQGTVRDVVVVESTSSLFERAATEAALKFKYKPRVIDGEPVEVPGVRNKITFEIQD